MNCHAAEWTGNINMFNGITNHFKVSSWDYSDHNMEWGIFFDVGKTDWLVNVAVDYMQSYYDYDIGTEELDIGFRKTVGNQMTLAPFFGGGISFFKAKFDYQGISDDDSGIGCWMNIGWYMNLTEYLNFAWEFRYTTARATLFDQKGDVGGWKAGVLLGLHF